MARDLLLSYLLQRKGVILDQSQTVNSFLSLLSSNLMYKDILFLGLDKMSRLQLCGIKQSVPLRENMTKAISSHPNVSRHDINCGVVLELTRSNFL